MEVNLKSLRKKGGIRMFVRRCEEDILPVAQWVGLVQRTVIEM
jgi:hypothetical protein